MVKYEYVTVKSEKALYAQYTKHREIINEYAKKGYRYTGYFPTKISAHGQFTEIDLIFEINE